jgi:hypothetical protein
VAHRQPCGQRSTRSAVPSPSAVKDEDSARPAAQVWPCTLRLRAHDRPAKRALQIPSRAELKTYLHGCGIEIGSEQQTKTKAALEFFKADTQSNGSGAAS